MKRIFLDTSAVLTGAIKDNHDIILSPITLSELEHIKTADNKPDNIKYLAREAVRDILQNSYITFTMYDNKKIDHLLKKYNFLSNINDHRILCQAALAANNDIINFYTNDAAQYLFAKRMKELNPIYI